MHEEADFLAKINANWTDNTAKLIFADWLDDRRPSSGLAYRLLGLGKVKPIFICDRHPYRTRNTIILRIAPGSWEWWSSVHAWNYPHFPSSCYLPPAILKLLPGSHRYHCVSTAQDDVVPVFTLISVDYFSRPAAEKAFIVAVNLAPDDVREQLQKHFGV